jgi:hypothetical protein
MMAGLKIRFYPQQKKNCFFVDENDPPDTFYPTSYARIGLQMHLDVSYYLKSI